MKKTTIVNIYNFIRMSHVEPSYFIEDDFETIRNQLIQVKQYGLPGTYALKYDALMEPRYQELLREYLDDNDEISAWWEITEPLCRKAGVPFRGKSAKQEEYDDRVDSAYCVGYSPDERKLLVDAYMKDFYNVFGKYPQTIGSWVLDSVTLEYAAERYGVVGGAICRDQMATDGFTLWGGYPNGPYFPSKSNEFIPAQEETQQLSVPMFRLLSPDPIYNFEADVREGIHGVYTLEPSWLTGRDPKFISWLFESLTDEDTLGTGYAHVGQENNFLWENIKPGFQPQLEHVRDLEKAGKVRVETMAQSARWFRQQYRITPPLTFQASRDWDETRNLSAQWYASADYRMGLLAEDGHLRIRDMFLYRQDYASRYLNGPMTSTKSNFDALPVMFPQLWGNPENRPFIRMIDAKGREPIGRAKYSTLDEESAQAVLLHKNNDSVLAAFTMTPNTLTLEGGYSLLFDQLPVLSKVDGKKVVMVHEGYSYDLEVETGSVITKREGLVIQPDGDKIVLIMGAPLEKAQYDEDAPIPEAITGPQRPVPPMAPVACPPESVFAWGKTEQVSLSAKSEGVIHYTLDGSEPTEESPVYEAPIAMKEDKTLKAKLFAPDGTSSETLVCGYRFGLKDIILTSPTELDPRPSFTGNGMKDLLTETRGTLDYLDGRWRGTLQDIDVTGVLSEPTDVESISMGFLSHHRSGIVYPDYLELFVGPDTEHLQKLSHITLPCAPCARELAKRDVNFYVNTTIGAFRVVAHRYEKMPQWCCYHGAANVFTMTDKIIVKPKKK